LDEEDEWENRYNGIQDVVIEMDSVPVIESIIGDRSYFDLLDILTSLGRYGSIKLLKWFAGNHKLNLASCAYQAGYHGKKELIEYILSIDDKLKKDIIHGALMNGTI